MYSRCKIEGKTHLLVDSKGVLIIIFGYKSTWDQGADVVWHSN